MAMPRNSRRVALACGVLCLGCASISCVRLTRAYFEKDAIQSVQRELTTKENLALEAYPNQWGEGFFVFAEGKPDTNQQSPVWVYLGDATYALDSASRRLTPRILALTDATPAARARVQLDRVSVEEIRAYLAERK
jgi:arginine/ornithine N-succinyltransferase beta subunit